MFRAIFLIPRIAIAATCAVIVFGVAAPLFWLHDRVRGEL